MIVLNVLIVILGLLLLLLLIPVGVDVGYNEDGLRVYARVSCVTIPLYPRKASKKKKKPKKQETVQQAPEPQPTEAAATEAPAKKKRGLPDITKDEVLDLIGVAVRSVRKLRFCLHKLKLHFISAFPDPYQTAMIYGYASAGVNALGLPQMKRADVQLAVDFEREKYYVDGYLSVTIKIYYIMKLALCAAFGALPILLRRRKRMKVKDNSVAVKGKVA